VLDLRLIRRDPDAVRAALARRGDVDVSLVDRVVTLDVRKREILPRLEGLRAEQNAANQAIAQAKKSGEGADEAIARMRAVAGEAKALNEELAQVDAELTPALAQLPNLPDETAAPEDTVVKEVGEPWLPSWPVRDHLELAGADRIDMERGARLSGSRFAYLRGAVARLELALVSWAMDHLAAQGFEPVIPPVLVREEALYGTGFLPDTEQQIYHLPADDLYLVGTSEVALASLHAGEILDGETLPRRYAGFSSCFRREAGAAGKDTRGIFRVHQFDKVEMFSFVDPELSRDEHERLLSIEESILQALNIPYRVVNIAVDDLGASAAKKYDCEAWLPSQQRYRELTSTSNTTDYQARRLEIRYRPTDGRGRPETLHTLNGTAVAVGRTIIAILENGQQEDGSILLPEVLRGYGMPESLPAAAA
jgi:seryl-tRNA synthetase